MSVRAHGGPTHSPSQPRIRDPAGGRVRREAHGRAAAAARLRYARPAHAWRGAAWQCARQRVKWRCGCCLLLPCTKQRADSPPGSAAAHLQGGSKLLLLLLLCVMLPAAVLAQTAVTITVGLTPTGTSPANVGINLGACDRRWLGRPRRACRHSGGFSARSVWRRYTCAWVRHCATLVARGWDRGGGSHADPLCLKSGEEHYRVTA